MRTHGERYSPIYRLWAGMRNRCNNPNEPKYPKYGGRGIKVCEEWDTNYVAFREWCVGNGYEKGLSLERKDVNGNYEPSNCTFATQKVQQNNRTNNHLLTYQGDTHTMSEWADLLGYNYKMLESRITRGWAIKEAFTTPKGGRRNA